MTTKGVLDELIDLLALERIEADLFRGRSQDLGWGQVFGGQVIGQALSAATQTVPPDRHVHSLHSYFLRPGDASRPIVYEVDRIRDGKSFATRRVVGVQGGRPIFNMSASFQQDEPGFEHADPMPQGVRGPDDGLVTELELWRRHADKIPADFRSRALAERPIDVIPVDPVDSFRPEKKSPDHAVWLRASGVLPDNPALHRYLLAYCSDFSFMTTAMRPHGATWVDPAMQVASIDHIMWFHRPFRLDEGVLHCMHSPSASGARGLVLGSVFSRDGTLVASTAQEGLIRRRS
ncbi:MAG: acyl-CoA thioesterase II [Deltaproteobacteria bacterium]|nr:acyl-CoA thioesterase II [Deltaproteobacteria bacterium]